MHIKSAYKTELEIVEGLKADDENAFKAIYKQHFSVISKFIINNSGSEQEAKDIFQDSIIVLFRNIREVNFKLDCKIRTYLYSVSRRLWLNELKKRGKTGADISDYENFIIFNEVDEIDFNIKERQLALIAQSLSILGEPCNTIITDFYINRFSMQAIADKMGYTNFENAKNQKYKCLQRLKKIYFKSYDLDEE